MQIVCLAVICGSLQMSGHSFIYTHICVSRPATHPSSGSITVPFPEYRRSQCFTLSLLLRLPNREASSLNLPSAHHRSSCCGWKHKTNVSLSQRGEFITVTKRLMGLRVFQNKQAVRGLYHSKRAHKSWDCLLRGVLKKSGARAPSFRILK